MPDTSHCASSPWTSALGWVRRPTVSLPFEPVSRSLACVLGSAEANEALAAKNLPRSNWLRLAVSSTKGREVV